MRVFVTRGELVIGTFIAATLAVGLIISVWTVVQTSSGPLMLTWTAAWCFGAGVVGWFKRSWLWPGLCPVAMIALVLLWVTVFAHTSWTSAFITVLGAVYAVAATIGAVVGAWLGKRRVLLR
jgi:hypothetical protein